MKPTLFAGFIVALVCALPAHAQDSPAQTEKQKVTVRINQVENNNGAEHKGTVKIVRIVNGKEEVIERSYNGEMPADLKEKMKSMHIDITGDSAHVSEFYFNTDATAPKSTDKQIRKVVVYSSDDKTNKPTNVRTCKPQEFDFSFVFGDGKPMMSDKAGEQSSTHIYKLSDGKEVKVCISKIYAINITEITTKTPNTENKATDIIEEAQISELSVYPNPNNGEFNLKLNLTEKGNAHVMLLDQKGKLLYEEKLTDFIGEYNKPLSLEGQKAGNYILKILQNGKTYTRQVVVR